MAVDLVVLAAVFVSVTVVSIAIRVFTRIVILKNLGIDDYLISFGAVFAIVCSVTPIAAISYGLGRPIAEQRPEEVAPYQKLILTSSISYSVSALFIKLSLLTFYTRLSAGPAFQALVYVVIFVVLGAGIASVTTVLLQCIPLSALWDEKAAATAKCIRVTDFYYANAAINIATDVAILLLPGRILWGLHMPLRQRISLCALFGLGGLACVASIIRLTTISSLLSSSNPTLSLVTPLNWSIIELNVSIFIAGAPALKAFLRRCMPALLGSSYSPTGQTKYGSTGKSRQTRDANSIPLGSMNDKGGSVWRNEVSGGKHLSKDREGDAGSGEGSREGSQENILMSYHGILQEVTVSVKSERRSVSTRRSGEEGREGEGKMDFGA